MKDLILNEVENLKASLFSINDYMYYNPELGNEEFKAVGKLAELLMENNFTVEIGIAGKATAFKAVYDSQLSGPTVSYLCEYDALPEIGHGCGHNMIGTMSAGAAVALSKVLNKIGGRIVVFGTPAEETDGGKVYLAEQGVFSEVDVAMMLHPADANYESGTSQAMDAIQFLFKGKPSHAASSPEKGINALDAAILTFNGINALRQHVTSGVRIHGIIKEGGVAANIVPERAVAQFYVRAAERGYLNEVVEKVKNVARGAALMTGATLEISNYELSYDNLVTNRALSQAITNNLKYMGVTDINPPAPGYGSSDIGNVSQVVPSIHPYIGLGCPGVPGHTREWADSTISDKGHEALIQGTAALALTGYDVITNKELLEEIKREFKGGN
jgi:amidohydrolase